MIICFKLDKKIGNFFSKKFKCSTLKVVNKVNKEIEM